MSHPQFDPDVDVDQCFQAQARAWSDQMAEIVQRPGAVPEGPTKDILLSMGNSVFYFIHHGDMIFDPNLLQIR